MRAKVIYLGIIALFIACSSVDVNKAVPESDNNDLAYRLRYSDISASLQAARNAYSCSEKNPDGRAEALNNMAYVAYQQMRYDQSLHLLQKIYGFSRNQLELLCADVLTMKVMQRIGHGKSFFDARLRAEKRLSRLLSEENNLTARQKHRLDYALTEYHIVASTYYYYLGQDSAARREIAEASKYINLNADTTQWLYYQYMLGSGGLVEGTSEEVTLTEFNHLFRVYTLAKANGFTYFEANALQSLSAMIADSMRAEQLKQQRTEAYIYLYSEHLRWQKDSTLSPRHQFAAVLSHHSVSLFQQYRDLFQTACALRTLGEVYFSSEHYDEALRCFDKALHLASGHNRRSPYSVKPWLAGIHENLSLTYSALGNKSLADSHRNTYLDLLDDSRQNLELGSRKALLKQEARSEHLRFVLLLVLVVLVAILAYVYYRQLANRSRSFERQVCEIASSEVSMMAQQRLDNLLQESEERLESLNEEYKVTLQDLQNQQEIHILQRTKLSVVYAIIPYLDRVIAEVKRLDAEDTHVVDRLSYIQELCSGMMTVNDRLTSWIQMQQGSLSLHVKRFPLNDVLHVIAMQQYAFTQQQLTLEIPETDLIVRADKALTLFMVNTLVDNARKFTPSGGLVSVRLDSTDAYVEVSVCDTGIGLSQEDVQALCDSKVYDPNSIGVTDAGKGFGFGIMNCKGIIGSYRKLSSLFNVCDFGVESEQGSGSRFWFRLPRVLPVLFFFLSHLALQAMPQRCYELYDSAFAANVDGRYTDAYLLCENALQQTEAPVDTPLLVSLYNEQAIAAQTLGDWEAYRRSNAECVRLHRLYSTDGTLASDCQRLEKMNSNSRVLYALMVLLLIASLALFYRVVLRHRLRHHASLDVLYQKLLSVLQTFPENINTIEDELQEVAHSLEHPRQKKSVQELLQTFTEGLEKVKKAEAVIRETEEKEQRWRFEHDRLYVMNQILDNSLSTIKHETMYFPSRIKQMADDMQQKGFDAVTQRNLLDLVTYYRHIHMLLYEQAQRQTDQSPLRIQDIALDEVIAEESKNGVTYSDTGLCVRGDKTLLRLFFKQLIAIAPSGVSIDAERRGGMVYVICTVEGEHLSSEQLSGLFSPQTGRIECLVMRQIIHELDAACSHPGLRLVADDTKTGYSISFSLLASGKPKH